MATEVAGLDGRRRKTRDRPDRPPPQYGQDSLTVDGGWERRGSGGYAGRERSQLYHGGSSGPREVRPGANSTILSVSALELQQRQDSQTSIDKLSKRRNSKVHPESPTSKSFSHIETASKSPSSATKATRKSSILTSLDRVEPPKCPTLLQAIDKIWKILGLQLVREFVARALYITYYVFLVISVVDIGQNKVYYWLYLSGFGIYIFEIFIFSYIYRVRKIPEPKYWTPSVASFILVALPLQDLIVYLRYIHGAESLCSVSGWEQILRDSIFEESFIDAASLYSQLMIIILVFGRWIFKNKNQSSEAISQMLIATMGAGADIVELLDVFETDNLCSLAPIKLYWMVIPIYNLSVLQFVMVLTAKRKRKVCKESGDDLVHWFWYSESWGLAITVIMQDGPFFLLRCVLMIMGDVTQTRIFFTIKNFLMCALVFNRILVIRKQAKRNTFTFGSNTLAWK